jgi:hypothetical protein
MSLPLTLPWSEGRTENPSNTPLRCTLRLRPAFPTLILATRVAQAARDYIERSKQKSRKTYLGYRAAVNLFVASCKKTYFDEICRDDLLDFLVSAS